MSDLAPVKPPGRLIPPQGGSGTARPNPLKDLPGSLIIPAGRFFAFWAETLKDTTALVARLRWWMDEEGLTAEDAAEAMRRLMQPERASQLEYSGKVLAELASVVGQLLKLRREAERQMKFQEKCAADRADAAPWSLVRQAINRIGNPE